MVTTGGELKPQQGKKGRGNSNRCPRTNTVDNDGNLILNMENGSVAVH